VTSAGGTTARSKSLTQIANRDPILGPSVMRSANGSSGRRFPAMCVIQTSQIAAIRTDDRCYSRTNSIPLAFAISFSTSPQIPGIASTGSDYSASKQAVTRLNSWHCASRRMIRS